MVYLDFSYHVTSQKNLNNGNFLHLKKTTIPFWDYSFVILVFNPTTYEFGYSNLIIEWYLLHIKSDPQSDLYNFLQTQ